MKNTFINLLLVGLLGLTADLNAQWLRLKPDNVTNFKSIHFVNLDTGFVVGRGLILKTVDGGASWSDYQISAGSTESLQTVTFSASGDGYAAGKSIYKTTNSGLSWDSLHTTYPSQGIEAVQSLHFPDDSTGIAVGIGRHITTDAGATWFMPQTDPSNIGLTVNFVNNKVGFIGGWMSTSSAFVGQVSKTSDGGRSWGTVRFLQPQALEFEVRSIYFINELRGWVAGKRIASGTPHPYSNIRVLFTIDGGETWDTISTVFPSAINTIVFANELLGFLGDDAGSIYSTTDGGQTWTKEKIPDSFGSPINEIIIVDNSVVFAVGNGGRIYKRSLVTSVDDEDVSQTLLAFPNPTHGVFRLGLLSSEITTQPCQIIALDNLGREVFQSIGHSNDMQFDFSDMPRGMYSISVRSGATIRVIPLLLQ